jgi:hypothetical protein
MRAILPLPLVLSLLVTLCACGPSAQQREQERLAREAAMQKAIADSLAEERAKDQRMFNAAAAEAQARIARDSQVLDAGLSKAAAADAAVARQQAAVEQAKAQDDALMQPLLERLRTYRGDPALVEIRNPQLSPKRNALCADFALKDKSGRYASGFKRVIVTDMRVTPEEPPVRDTMTQFLIFQVAARDTGCYPDVAQVRIAQ